MKFYKYEPIYPGSNNDMLEELLLDDRTPKCSDLISYILDKGQKIGKVEGVKLSDSSWLKSVVAYEYNNLIFSIVVLKKVQYSFDEKSYIFCKIPKTNWQRFSQPSSSLDKSYGEKFHVYIIDHKCNCK